MIQKIKNNIILILFFYIIINIWCLDFIFLLTQPTALTNNNLLTLELTKILVCQKRQKEPQN